MKTTDEVLDDIHAAGWRLYFLKEIEDQKTGTTWMASLGRGTPYITTAFHRGNSPAEVLQNALRGATSTLPEPVPAVPEPEPEEDIFG